MNFDNNHDNNHLSFGVLLNSLHFSSFAAFYKYLLFTLKV